MKRTGSHIGTNGNVADFFTKVLTWAQFNKFRTYFGGSLAESFSCEDDTTHNAPVQQPEPPPCSSW